jgi:uncharacterized repeat protein (TIGR01451 family)
VQAGDATIVQPVALDAGASAPTLGFWYRLAGITAGDSRLEARIDDGLVGTTVFSTTQGTDGWAYRWVDLTPWGGQQVTLVVSLHQAAARPPVWAYLDEVTAGAAYPDLWVTKSAPEPFLEPGAPVEYTITYGNRGGAEAVQAVLTDTLPSGLEFVSADPPPTAIAPYLTWSVGDLAAGSGPATITLVAVAAPGPPPTGTVTNRVEIGSASPEMEDLNNQALAEVWFGWRALLPIAVRQH